MRWLVLFNPQSEKARSTGRTTINMLREKEIFITFDSKAYSQRFGPGKQVATTHTGKSMGSV